MISINKFRKQLKPFGYLAILPQNDDFITIVPKDFNLTRQKDAPYVNNKDQANICLDTNADGFNINAKLPNKVALIIKHFADELRTKAGQKYIKKLIDNRDTEPILKGKVYTLKIIKNIKDILKQNPSDFGIIYRSARYYMSDNALINYDAKYNPIKILNQGQAIKDLKDIIVNRLDSDEFSKIVEDANLLNQIAKASPHDYFVDDSKHVDYLKAEDLNKVVKAFQIMAKYLKRK